MQSTVKSSSAVRTKYDRMFERKNQSILAPHYSALVAHDDEDGEDGDDDVFTLARRDHDIEGGDVNTDDPTLQEQQDGGTAAISAPLVSADELSKRKQKAATSKKAMLKSRPMADKLVFDDVTGEARNFYESGRDVEDAAGDQASRQQFLAEERERMKEAHRVDKEVAREKKREKKRKRQERERQAREGSDAVSDGEGVAVIGGGLSDEDDEDERPIVKNKRSKQVARLATPSNDDLEDEEALALRLLQG